MNGAETLYPPVSTLGAALFCRCPRCGKGELYSGLLTVAPSCRVCGLDLRAQDAGDGPAAFVVLILGAIVVALAIAVEIAFAPPSGSILRCGRRSSSAARLRCSGH